MSADECAVQVRVHSGEIALCIAVLVMIGSAAVPQFGDHHSDRARSCVANLKQLDSAKEQYAMDHKLDDGAHVPPGILWVPEQYIKSEPKCPDGGQYTLGVIGVNPICTLGDKWARDSKMTLANTRCDGFRIVTVDLWSCV